MVSNVLCSSGCVSRTVTLWVRGLLRIRSKPQFVSPVGETEECDIRPFYVSFLRVAKFPAAS